MLTGTHSTERTSLILQGQAARGREELLRKSSHGPHTAAGPFGVRKAVQPSRDRGVYTVTWTREIYFTLALEDPEVN